MVSVKDFQNLDNQSLVFIIIHNFRYSLNHFIDHNTEALINLSQVFVIVDQLRSYVTDEVVEF